MTNSDSNTATGPQVEAPVVDRHQEIEARAHELWIQRGCPIGSPDEDWFRAEEELRGEAKSAAAPE